MPDITNPEAVRYCNERIRRVADAEAQLYYLVKAAKGEWDANALGTIIGVNSDSVVDGSLSDGRHPITGNDVNGIIARMSDLITDLEASGGAKLNSLLAVAVDPLG